MHQHTNAMSTSERTTAPSAHESPLADHTKDDMPAARTLIILVVVLLAGFAVVAGIMNFKSQNDTLNPLPPTEVTEPAR